MFHFHPIIEIPTDEYLISIICLNHLITNSKQNLIPTRALVLMSLKMAIDKLKILAQEIYNYADGSFIAKHITSASSHNSLTLSGITIDDLISDKDSNM